MINLLFDYISQTHAALITTANIFECTGFSGFVGAKVLLLIKN